MSAFVVSNRTMTRVLYALHLANSLDAFAPFVCGEDLGGYLLAMNADAVAQRYNEEPEPVVYRPERGLTFTPCDALKGLECFIYQCSEGNVPKREEFKILEYARDSLINRIIANLPDYKSAAWNSHED